jgi:hypothetical protein
MRIDNLLQNKLLGGRQVKITIDGKIYLFTPTYVVHIGDGYQNILEPEDNKRKNDIYKSVIKEIVRPVEDKSMGGPTKPGMGATDTGALSSATPVSVPNLKLRGLLVMLKASTESLKADSMLLENDKFMKKRKDIIDDIQSHVTSKKLTVEEIKEFNELQNLNAVKEIRKIYSELDPYGEENWNE